MSVRTTREWGDVRFLLASTRLPTESYRAELREVNGEPSVILRTDDRAILVAFIALEQEQIREIRAIGNPDKLQRL